MPMYTYVDTKTNKEIDVLRDIDNRDIKPTAQELEDAKLELDTPEWQRIITKTKFTRGPGWCYRKPT